MTIASCYVTPEGIVLGADSTSTYETNGVAHYFNHAQKLFEIGKDSSLGLITWGLGSFGAISYRRLIAECSETLIANPPKTVAEVCTRWIDHAWKEYQAEFASVVQEVAALNAKLPLDPVKVGDPAHRSAEEERRLAAIQLQHFVGFCIGGYTKRSRVPMAFAIGFDITKPKPTPNALGIGVYFWGAPSIILRLVRGYDLDLREALIKSGNWSGTPADLDALLAQYALDHSPTVPIRDAIDFVHSSIMSTIKALKFSRLSQICGGPIEIAAITADRPFRWVRHKMLDQAISEGEP